MSNTIYASFDDASLAEKAAGALLDHGVLAEHLSLVRTDKGRLEPEMGSAFTSGAVIGGPGAISSTGTGIQHGGRQSLLNGPATTGFGTSPSPGHDDLTNRGYVSEESAREIAEKDDRDYVGDYPAEISPGIGANDVTATGLSGDFTRNAPPENLEETAKHGITTTSSADAGAGAVKGTEIGAGVGVLAALASLFIPGVGIVIGGGALAIAIAGVVGSTGAGAAAGALFGFLRDQGMTEPIAREYGDRIVNGGALIAVQAPSGNVSEQEIRQIVAKYGAVSLGNVGQPGYLA
jgi:hypothetical protein